MTAGNTEYAYRELERILSERREGIAELTAKLEGQTAILEEEQERVGQRGERIRLLSEELSMTREKLAGQTALAARRLDEINRLNQRVKELRFIIDCEDLPQ